VIRTKRPENRQAHASGHRSDAKVEGDNPTIGLILCSKKNEAVAKYSVLKESKHLFAARYMAFLPTEEELQLELERERRLIEARNNGTDVD
jgi:hypothetical protein